jgi:hypothetical protein
MPLLLAAAIFGVPFLFSAEGGGAASPPVPGQFEYSWNCSRSEGCDRPHRIVGVAPVGNSATKHPVFLFLGRGGAWYDSHFDSELPLLMYALRQATQRGFLAATLDNIGPTVHQTDCAALDRNARDLFTYNSVHDNSSALAVLCAHPAADCAGSGVVVAGFSMGGLQAHLAPTYSRFVQAVASDGAGNIVPGWNSTCGATDQSGCAKGDSVGGTNRTPLSTQWLESTRTSDRGCADARSCARALRVGSELPQGRRALAQPARLAPSDGHRRVRRALRRLDGACAVHDERDVLGAHAAQAGAGVHAAMAPHPMGPHPRSPDAGWATDPATVA